MQPSEVLLAAADRVRDLAAAATDGPWLDVQDGWCIRSEPSKDRATWQTVCEGYSPENGRWIAALSPAIGEPLETWLRQAASEVEQAWKLFEPGTPRFALYIDESGAHTGDMSTGLWTEESRLEALQPRWGSALSLAAAILGSGADTQ